jgi:ubiquitin carboxyl-terminal hydrolase 10
LGNASQQVLVNALPPVLVLHLNRVQYDAAAGGITKIGKSIQFGPELKIPLGKRFSFTFLMAAEG